MQNVGQRPGTFDCGFFAGFGLNLVHQFGDGASSAPFSDDDVFAVRNRYLDKFGGGGFAGALKDRHKSVNSADTMFNYLSVLGCGVGYTSEYYSALRDRGKLRKLLINHVPEIGARYGLLLSIRSVQEGHWICVLGYGAAGSAGLLPKLWKGMPNPKVPLLQESLNAVAKPNQQQLEVDGLFGNNTEARVIEFQRTSQIGVDGIVGRETWGELDEQLGGSGNTELYHIYDPGQIQTNYLFGFTQQLFLDQLERVGVSLVISQT